MTTARPSRAPPALLALLLVLAGGLRIYLAWQAHAPTLDTAVVGQMALDILDGDRPAFFAGQNYMGALEAYLLALVFRVLPAGRVTMTFVTIGFALAWIAATFFFFRRQYGAGAALAAALVPAFPGWPTAWYTTAPYGGYPETYFFGMILLLLALPFLDRRGFTPSVRHALIFAAVAGLGLWTNLQVLPYLAAAGLAGLRAWRRRPHPFRMWLPYGMVLLAGALAFLPQLLAESSHVQAPLFGGLSLEAVGRSGRALFRHDLRQSMLWTYPPATLHVLAAILLAGVTAGGAWLAFQGRREEPGTGATTSLVLVTVAVFALTYFPHPMSGFVPRYFNAPLALILGWSLAGWVRSRHGWIRRAGWAAALLLALYNATGVLIAANARKADRRQTITAFQEVIQAARSAGWDAVLDTGSQTEGYDGARLTFLAGGRPVFASAFSDRFLEHQLAWEFGDHAAYLVRRRHLPFIEGSLAALNVPLPETIAASSYVLFDTPEVARQTERSRMPDAVADWMGPVARHPLFDRVAATTWPEPAASRPATLTMRFSEPVRLAGLRASAMKAEELPYRYTVRVQRPDGAWITVQDSQRRLAGSYLSGTRLYFRGHHPWMDIRFEPVAGTALEWTVQPGPDNPVAPRLDDLHVLEATGQFWPEWNDIRPGLQAALEATPDATIVAERGVLRALHRGIVSDPLASRIPLPYNPRFARTRLERLPLVEGHYAVVIEAAYRDAAQAVIEKTGIVLLADRPVPPFHVLLIAIEAAASGKAAWHGFQLLEGAGLSP